MQACVFAHGASVKAGRGHRIKFALLGAIILPALVAGCSSAPPLKDDALPPKPPAVSIPHLNPVKFSDLPNWSKDRLGEAIPALVTSCAKILDLPADRVMGPYPQAGRALDWVGPCSTAKRIDPADHHSARAFFEEWFQPYALTDQGKETGTFTGYYEPMLEGSLYKTPEYNVPLLARPNDLVSRKAADGTIEMGRNEGGKFVPYHSRAEIEAGVLKSRAEPLIWLKDAVDAHIMHIQGSGKIRLPDGRVVQMAVAATNGLKFVGIGRVMKERGLISELNMPAIRTWLKANPDRAREIMALNPRYVFYRFNKDLVTLGAQGVPLTAKRSMAVDTRYVPLGVPVYLDSVDPDGQNLDRLMVAQDIGGAIKGVVRGDFFWGTGEQAFYMAGRMKSNGRYWLLLPKETTPAVAQAF